MRWIDLDLPPVIELRRKYLEDSERLSTLPASVLVLSWLDALPAVPGEPILFQAEGLFMYLEPEEVRRLVVALRERFPGSGLSGVCRELVDVARASKQRIVAVSRPNWALRVGIALILILGIGLLGYVATIIEIRRGTENLFGVLEGIDAAVNTLVLTGAGIFFLATLERRWRRQRALADLHELRTLVHVIDMHQLTKDPSKVSNVSTSTPSSPKRLLT
ncbi:MAG: hypothetical protein ABUJ93_12685, partial [Hyphomicrobium sp.]